MAGGRVGDLRGLLADRRQLHIIDSSSRLVITADEDCTCRTQYPAEKNVDDAKTRAVTSVEHVIVLKRTGSDIDWQEGRDYWWHLIEKAGLSTSLKR